ncbi:hypothetical protein JCM10212_007105 [Sporobolomyces blumeae]
MCPLAPLLALPGMTERWYVKRDVNDMVIDSRPDPTLVVALGATVFVISVLADVSILFRLLDVRSRFFTLLTLAFLGFHALLILIGCTVFALRYPSQGDAGFTVSTSFWLSVSAAALACVVVTCLLADGFRTKWYTKGGIGVTPKQCGLIVAFNIFVVAVLIGTSIFKQLLSDSTWLDSLYFCLQGATTVGFGEPVATSAGGRALTIVFFPFAITSFAVLVGFTSSTVLESIEESYERRRRDLQERRRKRRRPGSGQRPSCCESGLHETVAEGLGTGRTTSTMSAKGQPSSSHEAEPSTARTEVAQRLEQQRSREFRTRFVVSALLVVAVWLVGTGVFSSLEKWSFGLAFYFCFVSISTIGFGDVSPSTQAGRAFFCMWILVGAGALTIFFSVLVDAYSTRHKETFQRKIGSDLVRFLRDPTDQHTRDHSPRQAEASSTSPNAALPVLRQVQSMPSFDRQVSHGCSSDVDEKAATESPRSQRVVVTVDGVESDEVAQLVKRIEGMVGKRADVKVVLRELATVLDRWERCGPPEAELVEGG